MRRNETKRNETKEETENETKRPVQFTPSALHRDEIKANHKKEKEKEKKKNIDADTQGVCT
jgi:hypothetical protein